MSMIQMAFETIVECRENARYWHFLLFPQFFSLPCDNKFLSYEPNLSSENILNMRVSEFLLSVTMLMEHIRL